MCVYVPSQAQRHSVTPYNAENGLAGKYIFYLYQDSKGFIWTGCNEGISRFDGVSFESFQSDSLAPSGITFQIKEDQNKHIWTGAYDQLGWYDGKAWKKLTGVRNVRSIFYDKQGRLCFFMVNTIFRYDEKTQNVEVFKIMTDMMHTATQLPNGKMLIVSDNKRLRLLLVDLEEQKPFFKGKMTEIFENPALVEIHKEHKKEDRYTQNYDTLIIPENLLARKIFTDKDNKVWVGTEKGVFLLTENDTFEPFFEEKIKGVVRQIAQAPNGSIYFTTSQGIFVWNGVDLELYNAQRGFKFSAMSAALIDKNDDIWVGYGTGLVEHLFSKKFARFTSEEKDFDGKLIRSPIKDQYGNLIFFTTEGTYRHDGERFVKHKNPYQTFLNCFADSSNRIWIREKNRFTLLSISPSIDEPFKVSYLDAQNGLHPKLHQAVDYPERYFVSSQGDVWMTTYFGVFVYRNQKWTFIEPKHCAASTLIREDTEGNMWVGTWCSLEKIQGDSIVQVYKEIRETADTSKYVNEPAVVDLTVDKNGTVWINAMNTAVIAKPKNKDFKIYTTKDGYRSEDVSITFDNDGEIWFFHKRGIDVLKDGKFEPLTDENKLPYAINDVSDVFKDEENNVWISTSNGLYKYANQKMSLHTREDGLVNNDVSEVFDFKNKLYISHNKGFSYYLKQYDTPQKNDIKLVFQEVLINNKPQDLRQSIVIPKGKNTIEIDFALLDYRKREQNLYSYKLEGIDADWSEFKPYNFAKYSSLPPGNYKFYVKSKNSEGIIIENERHLKILAEGYFYQKSWFYILASLLFMALVYMIYRVRIAQIKKQKQRLEAIVEERTLDLKAKNTELEMSREEIMQQNEKIQETANELQTTNDSLSEAYNEIQKKNADVLSSINYALTIQSAILPSSKRLDDNFDNFVLYKPRDIVSGDFYWFAEKEDKKIFIAADCTGHGVAGAFMTMIGNNILNHIIHDEEIHAPEIILDKLPYLLGKVLLQETEEKKKALRNGMDIAIISFDTDENGQSFVDYSGAMIPLYYVQNDELKELKPDKYPIEPEPFLSEKYTKKRLVLTEDITMLYLFSDGYADQFGGPKDRKFMKKNLKKLLLQSSSLSTHKQKVGLNTELSKWKLDKTQTDDILVVGINSLSLKANQ